MTAAAEFGAAQEVDRKAGLEPLTAYTQDDLARVNRLIVEYMQSPVALIPQLAGHIVAAGGKRLRPMLTLASARLCGYEGERHIGLAACVEFIHTATLLHDDVVDDSKLRRGLDTANALFGNKASVLVGDFLFSRSFQLMVADGSLAVLRVLSNASATIAEGEVLQLMTSNNTATTEAEYLEVVSGKTAALFAAACEVGALVADRPDDECKALSEFGMSLGIAFQLIDDLLDYTADETVLGKAIGDDFREGKITLPIVLAFERGDDVERAFWRRCLEDMEQDEGDLRRAVELMKAHRALEDTRARAEKHGRRALERLGGFPDGPAKSALSDTLIFNLGRDA